MGAPDKVGRPTPANLATTVERTNRAEEMGTQRLPMGVSVAPREAITEVAAEEAHTVTPICRNSISEVRAAAVGKTNPREGVLAMGVGLFLSLPPRSTQRVSYCPTEAPEIQVEWEVGELAAASI